MEYQDQEMSDVIVVVEETVGGAGFDDLVSQIKGHGLAVETTDPANGVIEGTIPSAKIKTLQAMPEVKYVRGIFNYAADYPVGDPRNQDASDRPDEHIPR